MRKEQSNLLAEMPVGQALWKLSFPATMGMLINALYNVIDTIFVGRFVGDLGIAGLTVAFPIQMLALGIGGMFGMGCASIASRQLGAQEFEKADRTVSTTVFWNGLITLGMIAIGLVFFRPVLTLFGASETIYPYAADYMQIIFPGFFFFTYGVAINHPVRAEGRPIVAMISMISGAGGNILLDWLFMGVFHWGIRGAALATVASQILSAAILTGYLLSGHSHFRIRVKNVDFGGKTLRDITAIGASAFFTQAGASLLVSVLNHSLHNYGGDMAIAVYGVINKVTSFLIMPLIGIRQGVQPLLGYSWGAKNFARAGETLKIALRSMMIYSIVSYALVMMFAPQIVALFSGGGSLTESGTPALRITICVIFFASVQILVSALYQSFGRAVPAFITSLLRQFLILIPLILILPVVTGWGLTAIWIAFPAADVLSGSICTVLFIREVRALREPAPLGK